MDKARMPDEIVAELGALAAPADLDQATALLAELAGAVAGKDDLTCAKYREAALRSLAGKKLHRPAELVNAALAPQRFAVGSSAIQGGAIDLTTPEPWPQEVDGSALLEEISGILTRYLVLAPPAVVAVVLWVIHTHAFEAFWISPRLAIWSPVKRCAKTLLLELLEHLVPKALITANITAAAVFRGIEQYRPTLLIDEADTFLSDKDELRGILNSGHRRNGKVMRAVGDQHELRVFVTFAPVAIALIGRLPDTLSDRSIPIAMRRKKRNERVETLRPDRCGPLETLQRQACRWVLDHFDELAAADPEVPTQLHDREADNWRPLLAIADTAGGEWPARAREAAVALSASAAPDSQEDDAVLLLADLREIFDAERAPSLFTDYLVRKLGEREERPWGEWRGVDKPLTSRQMAALLRPFEVRPTQVRIGNRSTKGYKREDLEDAFSRYLPPLDPKHPKQVNGISDLREIPIRNRPGRVSDRKEAKSPMAPGIVSDVSDREGETGAEGVSAVTPTSDAKASADEVKV